MNILFVGTAFVKMLPRLQEDLPGHQVRACSREEMPARIAGSEILIPPGLPVGEELMRLAGPRLKLIQQWGVGVEEIDLDAAARAGIAVCNVPSAGTGNAESVAEMALLLMLALARRLPLALENVKKLVWSSPQGKSLWRKTACVVGLGHVGRAVLQRLAPFDMQLIGINRSWRNDFKSLPLTEFYPLSAGDNGLAKADFVILCLALNQNTAGFFSAHEFSLLKPNAFLINVARGGLVDKPALLAALRDRRLGGVGLDVFWQEPPDPADEIFIYPQVLATPHIAGITDTSLLGIMAEVVANISRLEKGLPPLNCLNPAAGACEVK
jgi:phosphoglycerate dehydrogenase-like enzyme